MTPREAVKPRIAQRVPGFAEAEIAAAIPLPGERYDGGRRGEAEDARADHDQICPRPLHRLIMGSKAPKRALAPRREPLGEWSRRGSNP